MTEVRANLQSRRPVHRKLFADWSERTFATYWKAFCQLQAIAYYSDDKDAPSRAILLATRPNGSFNVSRFARIAEDWAAMAIALLVDEEDAA